MAHDSDVRAKRAASQTDAVVELKPKNKKQRTPQTVTGVNDNSAIPQPSAKGFSNGWVAFVLALIGVLAGLLIFVIYLASLSTSTGYTMMLGIIVVLSILAKTISIVITAAFNAATYFFAKQLGLDYDHERDDFLRRTLTVSPASTKIEALVTAVVGAIRDLRGSRTVKDQQAEPQPPGKSS